jgi:hexosaminidase
MQTFSEVLSKTWVSTFVGSLARAFALGLLLQPICLPAQQPQLIPQPREVVPMPQSFLVTPNTQVILLTPVAPADRAAAASLEGELASITGQTYVETSVDPPQDRPAILLGRFDRPLVRRLLDSAGISLGEVGEQGYVLDVEPHRVLVAGKDADGLFYGVQTLRQLITKHNHDAEILGVRVRDWPALRYRGTQVEMAYGNVPKPEYIQRIIRSISEFKLNQLNLSFEDFPLEGHPLIGVLDDTISPQQWRGMVQYAAHYHVDLIPGQNSCGHMHKILRFEKYGPLGERPHGHVLAPGDPEVYSFLGEMIGQLSEIFPSSFYHAGCDETWELGKGRSRARAEQIGLGNVYLEHLQRVDELVRSRQKDAIFWSDIALLHPEVIKSMPRDLIAASWEYVPHTDADFYNRWIKPFQDAGMRVIVCPWVGNTNLLVPDYEEAAQNIEGFVGAGKKAAVLGMNNTVWNDDGQTLFGPNWWGIVYGAAVGWENGPTPVSEFNAKYDWAFYRSTDHRFVDAMMKLGHTNEIFRERGIGQYYFEKYGGTDDEVFWRDIFSPAGHNDALKALPVTAEVRRTAEDAYETFAESAYLAQRNADVLEDLKLAALRVDALAMRYEYLREMSDLYANALALAKTDRGGAMGELVEMGVTFDPVGRLDDLRDYTTRLREIYKARWLDENLPNWLPNVLQLFDQQSQQWHQKMGQFDELVRQFESGKPLPPPESLGLLPPGPAQGK